MIIEGDILHCHTTLITDSDDMCFIKGRSYEVEFIIGGRVGFINECNYEHTFDYVDYKLEDYYKQWFYTREDQLKILLDD